MGSDFHFSHVDFYPFLKLLSILFIPLSSFFLYCLSRFLLFFSEALPLLFGHCFRSSLSIISLYIHNLLFSYLQNISLVLSLSLSLSHHRSEICLSFQNLFEVFSPLLPSPSQYLYPGFQYFALVLPAPSISISLSPDWTSQQLRVSASKVPFLPTLLPQAKGGSSRVI